jgi:hypothetical protein
MRIRIVLLFSGIVIAASSGTARAAVQPLDPDDAPIAAVDRFSDEAGTLLLRSGDKRLPGPNEPIDFDTPALSTLGLSPTGQSILYYDLEHIQAFSIPGGIPKSGEQCESSVP